MRQVVLVGDEGPCPGWVKWKTLLEKAGDGCCLGDWRWLERERDERRKRRDVENENGPRG
jgi:hypothetical protein